LHGLLDQLSELFNELSVIRVFAGKKLQTEATFKTVLLNLGTVLDPSPLIFPPIRRELVNQ
jgi:hypothetical protein